MKRKLALVVAATMLTGLLGMTATADEQKTLTMC